MTFFISSNAWLATILLASTPPQISQVAETQIATARVTNRRVVSSIEQLVSINVTNIPLEKVLQQISKQGGIELSYSRSITPLEKSTTLHVTNVSAKVAIELALRGTNLTTLFSPNGTIALVQRPASVAPGIVIGRVVDEESSPVVGATVSVAGTRLMAITGREGFRLAQVPEGTQTLVVRYIGFLPESVSVAVRSNATTVRDIVLSKRLSVLYSVKVEGQRRGQAESINRQKTASNLKNVVSDEEIARLPDRNIAEALQRVPGVSMESGHGEGQGVVIRGIEPDLNSLTVDGVALPSSGGSRAVPLNLFSSDFVAAIEVSKTLTPDMDGDAIGGSINLVTPTPRENRAITNFTLSGGRSNQTGKSIRQLGGTYGNRFFNGRLGLLLGATSYTGGRGSDDIDVQWVDKKIGDQEFNVLGDVDFRDYDFTQDRRSLFFSSDYRFGRSAQAYMRVLQGSYEDDALRRRQRIRFGNGTYRTVDSITNSRIDRDLVTTPNKERMTFVTGGLEHGLGRGVFDYQLSMGRATREGRERSMLFSQRGVNFVTDVSNPMRPGYTITNTAEEHNPEKYAFTNMTENVTNIRDRDVTASVNMTLPYTLQSSSGAFKFGAKMRDKRKNRRFNANVYLGYDGDLALSDVAGTFEDRDFFLKRYRIGIVPGVNESARFVQENGGKFERNDTDSEIDSKSGIYDASETVFAWYLMTTHDIGRLRIIPGIRMERTTLTYVGTEILYNDDGDFEGTSPIQSTGGYTSFLPGVNLRYALSENSNIRAAFTQSMARPAYAVVAPSREVDRAGATISLGNPNLEPTRSTNIDLMMEYYSKTIGVLSAGFFHKRLGDYIFTRRFTFEGGPFDGYEASQPQNGADATLYGAEINWQQQLTFLPGALNGLGVLLNYTFTDSKTSFPERERKAPLPGQAKHIGNASLIYEKYGFSGRVATSFYGKNLTGVGDTPAEDVFFDNHSEMDISASMRVTSISRVFMEFANLIDGPRRRYRGTTNRPVEHEYYSWWMQFGIRLSR